ncbi:MAG: AI-2E family transporter [Oscillospiraceae bacterium]
MNNEDKRKIKIGIAISAFAVILYFGLQNFSDLQSIFRFATGILSPFIYGICFAFVLNILANFYETRVFAFVKKKKNCKWEKVRRPVCILLTIITFLGIIAGLVAFIIPQLMQSSKTLAAGIPPFIENLQSYINSLLEGLGVSTDLNQAVTSFLIDFSDKILSFVTASVPQILKATMNITSGVFNVFFGFIIAIYMLSTKESLLKNSKRIIYAYMPKKSADYATHIYRHVNTRFGGFVSGQLTEAVILGVLCFIGMQIFNMEYALLISVIIGITNIIPIVGPIIGAVPGVVIMLMIDPMKAVWFVVFIVVLQQIESNLIYPKVVGDSIGLPGLWVIFAILVGGGLFGFAGVILGVPAFAVIYTLIAENTTRRLKDRLIKL